MSAKPQESTIYENSDQLILEQIPDKTRHQDPFYGVTFSGRSVPQNRIIPNPPGKKPVSPIQHLGQPELGYTSENVDFVRAILTGGGLNPNSYRLPPLIRRISACLRALKMDSVSAARDLVSQNPQYLAVAVDSLLIGTTDFFRDEPVFRVLAKAVVPDLISRNAKSKVLSVASSGGEELYSVAMLFAHHGGLEKTRFVGRDIRESVIKVARQATYPSHATESIPGDLCERYLVKIGKTVSIHSEITKRVEWELHNVLSSQEIEQWDMILCRNLAIYLESEVSHHLWDRLSSALVPGGILVVGRAERPLIQDLNRIGPCIYKKNQNTHG